MLRFLSTLSVATKLSVSFCAVVLLLMTGVTTYNVVKAETHEQEDEEEALRSLAAATAGRLDQYIMDTRQRTEVFAADDELEKLLMLDPARREAAIAAAVHGDGATTTGDVSLARSAYDALKRFYQVVKKDEVAAPAPQTDDSVFVNIYDKDGAIVLSADETRRDRTRPEERKTRLDFQNAVKRPTETYVTSLFRGKTRPWASFLRFTHAVVSSTTSRVIGVVAFSIDATLIGHMVRDLAPEQLEHFGGDGDKKPTTVTMCTPPGKAPGALEVFLVDYHGAVLLPSGCHESAVFSFVDESGLRAAEDPPADEEYQHPFAVADTHGRFGTHGSEPLMAKINAAFKRERRAWSEGSDSSRPLWASEADRRESFAGIVPWDGRTRIVGMHPVYEARAHGWHVLYTEDNEDATTPLRGEHLKLFLGMVTALLVGSALMVLMVGFLMRQTKELHAGTVALAAGALATRIRVLTRDELGQLAESFNEMAHRLSEMTGQLETRNRFIRDTFGRYLTDEVVTTLLASPEGLALGGESRSVTILMSDLRGFSSLCEHLAAPQVVTLLNLYLKTMTEIIVRNGGTIDEFIGDAILVIFGAPVARADHAMRAVVCAIEMQLMMEEVNEHNRRELLPEVEMGIGIHTGEVVVGNIGSDRRAKYGVVGRSVNLASRIEALTVGGQVLVSEATLGAAGPDVWVDDPIEVSLKGARSSMTIFEVRGVRGERELSLPRRGADLAPLESPISVAFAVLDGVHAPAAMTVAALTALCRTAAVIVTDSTIELRSTMKITFANVTPGLPDVHVYAKVLRAEPGGYLVHFTSMPSEIEKLVTSRPPRGPD